MGFLKRLVSVRFKELPGGRRAYFPRDGYPGYIVNPDQERRLRRIDPYDWIVSAVYFAGIVAFCLVSWWMCLPAFLIGIPLSVYCWVARKRILRGSERTVMKEAFWPYGVLPGSAVLAIGAGVGIVLGVLRDPIEGLLLGFMAFMSCILLLSIAASVRGRPTGAPPGSP